MTTGGAHHPSLAPQLSGSIVMKSTCCEVVIFLNDVIVIGVSKRNLMDKHQRQSDTLTGTWTLQVIIHLNIRHRRIDETRRVTSI
jgi:hypothetical protein